MNACPRPLAILFLAVASLLCLPVSGADLVWTNSGGGNWNVAANWEPNQVPGATDNAYITNAGTYEVTINTAASAASLEVGGSTGEQILSLIFQSFTLTGPGHVSSNSTVALSGGSFAGTGVLVIDGVFNWSGGTIASTGGIKVQGSATLTGATKFITGGGLLENQGQATWDAGNIYMGFEGVWSNAVGGTVEQTSDANIVFQGGTAGVVANDGTWLKTGGTGVATLDAAFNNNGLLDVQVGRLGLGRGGTHGGDFQVSSGATLEFDGGTHELLASSSVSGAGRVLYSGSTTTGSGSYTITGTNEVSSGSVTLNLPNALNLVLFKAGANITINSSSGVTADRMEVTGGTTAFNSSMDVVTADLWVDSGGTLSVSNRLRATNSFQWDGGYLGGAGRVVSENSLAVAGSTKYITGGWLENQGQATWDGGNIYMGFGGVWSNAVSGTVEQSSDANVVFQGGTVGVIANEGAWLKTAGTGDANLDVVFNNNGVLDVQVGRLGLNRGGTHSGDFLVSIGATLEFDGGTHELLASSSVSGAGRVLYSGSTTTSSGSYTITGTNEVSSGNVTLNLPNALNLALFKAGANITVNSSSGVTADRIEVTAGTTAFNSPVDVVTPDLWVDPGGNLSVSNRLRATNSFQWDGGTVSGGGRVLSEGMLSMSGTTKYLSGAWLVNEGTALWDLGSLYMGYGAVWSNAVSGSVEQTSDANVTFQGGTLGTIANDGAWLKTGGTGDANVSAVFNNNGLLDVQAGRLGLSDGGTHEGDFLVSSGATLEFDGGTHELLASSSVSGAGRVLYSGSTTTGSGSYTITGTNEVSGGNVTLNLPNALNLVLFKANGNITVNSSMGINAGRIETTSGTTAFNTPADVVTPELLVDPGGTLSVSNRLRATSSFDWSGGTLSGAGRIVSETLLTLNGSTKYISGGWLENQGQGTWDAGNIYMGFGGVWSNAVGGTVEQTSDANVVFQGGAVGVIANEGTWLKTGTGNANLSAGFNNNGLLDVQAGRLGLGRGGTHAGDFLVSSGATLEFDGGTHELLASSSVSGAGRVLYSGSTTTGSGSYTITGTNEVSSGSVTLNLANALNLVLFKAGANITVNSSSGVTADRMEVTGGTTAFNTPVDVVTSDLSQSGSLSVSNRLRVTDSYVWTAGTISGGGSLIAETALTLSGTTKIISGARLVNEGSALWDAGNVNMGFGGGWSNAVSGTIETTSDADVAFQGGTVGVIANDGVWRKSGGAGLVNVSAHFHNAGTLEIQVGTFSLDRDGTHTGQFSISSGAVLEFDAGTHDVSASSSFSGAGEVVYDATSVSVLGTYSMTGTNRLTSGTLEINTPGGASFPNGVLSGGTLLGTNGLTVSGFLTWTGGTITGGQQVRNEGNMVMDGGTKTLNNATLINNGNTTWSAGQINFGGGATWSNTVSGTVDQTSDADVGNLGGDRTIANDGLWRKSGGTGDANLTCVYNNAGTLEVQVGTLGLDNGGTHTGEFNVSSGAVLEFDGGSHDLQTGTTVGGAGTVLHSGATVTMLGEYALTGTNQLTGGTLTIDTIGGVGFAHGIFSGGTLAGTNGVVVTNSLLWSGGTVDGGQLVRSEGDCLLTGSTKTLNGATLVNAGPAVWDSGNLNMGGGATLSNTLAGTLDIQTDADIGALTGERQILNAGLLQKTAGVSTTILRSEVLNLGTVKVLSGTIRFYETYRQEAGLTLLAGGDLDLDNPFELNGGRLGGTNQVIGTVTNAAVVAPGVSPGGLTISGDYIQTSDGTLVIELAGTVPGMDFDLLSVGGDVTLDGALQVTLTNGFYPAADTVFPFLTNNAQSGAFAAFLYPSNEIGLQVNYNADSTEIEVINVRPAITPIAGQATNELEEFSFLATATDDDTPAQTLTWDLVSGPAGLGIDTGGQISWIPTELQGPSTNTVTIKVSDDGTPNLAVTSSFEVVVQEVNSAPVPTGPENQIINEFDTLNVTATATDSDLPVNALSWELISGPLGLTVSTNGMISWSTDETHGLSTYPVSLRVTDFNPEAVNEQQLSATNDFLVTVNEVNLPPVLTVPTNQSLVESTLLSVAAGGADPDLPANPLSFSLSGQPSGMTIDPATGLISWTPTEAQGPTNVIVTVILTDDSPLAVNATHLSVTNSFLVNVVESNSPPILTVPENQVLDELTLLSVSAGATDEDDPANALTYSLVDAPTGMTINATNGLIEWTPSEGQGPTNATITVVVTDDNPDAPVNSQLSVTNSFSVTVQEVNAAPVATGPGNEGVDELSLLSVNATATDADTPANSVSWELISGPSGLTVSPGGQIDWTPTEAQGSNVYTVSIRVTDLNTNALSDQQLSDTNTFEVTVNEVNAAPVLTVPTNQVLDELTLLSVSAGATDGDEPANALAYSLVDPPTGMTINATNGLIEWTPSEGQGPTNATITVVVTDDNPDAPVNSQLSVTNTFSVTVQEVNLAPVLSAPPDQSVYAGSTVALNAAAVDDDLPANTLSYSLLSGPAGLTVGLGGTVDWVPTAAQIGTNAVTIQVVDDGTPSLSDTQAFAIVVIDLPTLNVQRIGGANLLLSWTAIPGQDYRLQYKEYKENLGTSSWTDLSGDVTATNSTASKGDVISGTNRLYRLQVLD